MTDVRNAFLLPVLLLVACGGGNEAESGADLAGTYEGVDPPREDASADTIADDAEIDWGPRAPDPTVTFGGDAAPDTAVAADTAKTDTAPPDASSFTCPDDKYDVDGLESNGCEHEDTLGNHSESSSVKFGLVGECDPYKVHDGVYASDTRVHLPSGESGVLGRADYFSWFHASSSCGSKPILFFTLDAVGTYEVALYPAGGSPDPACTKTLTGKTSIGPVYCSPAGSSAKYFWRVRKLSGPPEIAKYQLKFR